VREKNLDRVATEPLPKNRVFWCEIPNGPPESPSIPYGRKHCITCNGLLISGDLEFVLVAEPNEAEKFRRTNGSTTVANTARFLVNKMSSTAKSNTLDLLIRLGLQ
jgi:hypothetical protein